MIDKVVSIVLVFIVVLLGGALLYAAVFRSASSEQQLGRQGYEQLYSRTLFQAVLDTNEQATGMTYDSLLAAAIVQLNTTVKTDAGAVDVEQAFRTALDNVLGPDNYYIQVDPALFGVSVSYVLDSTDTLQEERLVIKNSLPDTTRDLKALLGENASVAVHVYMLGADGCRNFSKGLNVPCEDLPTETLYGSLFAHGLSPPIFKGYSSFSEWAGAQRNRTPLQQPTAGQPRSTSHYAMQSFLSDSDWASGVVYASYRYKEDPLLAVERASSNLHIIIVPADELSSSSKADDCFLKEKSYEWTACAICDNTCPVNRSLALVTQANAVVRKNKDYVIGIYAFNCDYKYNPRLNDMTTNKYTCGFSDSSEACCLQRSEEPARKPPASCYVGDDPPVLREYPWCEQAKCDGCTVPSAAELPPTTASCRDTNTCRCFHKACAQLIPDHMRVMVNGTGQFMELQEVNQLATIIQSHVNGLVQGFKFEIGTRNETRQRYVTEEKVMLSNGQAVRVELWVYE